MMPNIEEALLNEVDRVVNSGAISEEDLASYFKDGESFVLAKSIVTAWFRRDPYGPPNHSKSLNEFFRRISYI